MMRVLLILLFGLSVSCSSFSVPDPIDTELGIISPSYISGLYGDSSVGAATKIIASPLLLVGSPFYMLGWGLEDFASRRVVFQKINNFYVIVVLVPVEMPIVSIITLMCDLGQIR